MKRESKKRLSARDLRELGASPGLVVRRIPPDGGRQRVEVPKPPPASRSPRSRTKGARA